jgi:hypothetical protein
VTTYRVPSPAAAPHTAASSPSAARWALGLAASCEQWPQSRFQFVLPATGLPLFVRHEDTRFVSSGSVSGQVGAARYFAEISGLGVVCLIEVSAEYPSIMWDWAQGRQAGLSVTAHYLEDVPDGARSPVHFSEVSMCDSPRDPLAWVVSLGQMALDDWTVLTGEDAPALQ